MSKIKVVCISDSHGKHHSLDLPDGDILVHAGDFSSFGYRHEVESFANWLMKNKYKFSMGIVFVAGNHDRSFDTKYSKEYKGDGINKPEWITDIISELGNQGIHYLENESVVLDEHINIWGSPVTPDFYPETWAFNMHRDTIHQVWDTIPNNTDIVITHGPPHTIGDYVPHSMMQVGCYSLKTRLSILEPKLHVFGHIHMGDNITTTDKTIYCNAAVLDDDYKMSKKPTVVWIDK